MSTHIKSGRMLKAPHSFVDYTLLCYTPASYTFDQSLKIASFFFRELGYELAQYQMPEELGVYP